MLIGQAVELNEVLDLREGERRKTDDFDGKERLTGLLTTVNAREKGVQFSESEKRELPFSQSQRGRQAFCWVHQAAAPCTHDEGAPARRPAAAVFQL